MKQTILTALVSTVFTLTLIGLLGQLAPAAIIHWLGGVTHQELDRFRDAPVQELIPCYIWRGTAGSDKVRRLRDGSISLSPRDAAHDEEWQFTLLRK